ncbi:GntR family transcriptional regulator [Saccharothrix obliqua]|uniref:GntR family transcriptional regulator n=1 Tax=Saccharothrix obliqua TaxID=2861747 RepID=UPI001C5DB730|nr:GntR family transcriptional regulator [Saccharothrix obliqua]MBW4721419.1 GntR family transcriptional regulator [Saccharothrix obliqua]
MEDVKYRVIADHLIGAIDRGEYPVGTALPTLHELMDRFGVARGTARAAVAVLVAQGVATSKQGLGTLVCGTTVPPQRDTPRILPDGATYPKVVLSGWAAAGPDIAGRFGIGTGSLVVHRIRHHHTGARVTSIDQQWLPQAVASTIEEHTGHDISDRVNTPHPDLTPLLRNAGLDPIVATVQLDARLPTRHEADTLDIPSDAPVLVVHRITHGSSGTPVEATTTVSSTGGTAPKFTIPLTG